MYMYIMAVYNMTMYIYASFFRASLGGGGHSPLLGNFVPPLGDFNPPPNVFRCAIAPPLGIFNEPLLFLCTCCSVEDLWLQEHDWVVVSDGGKEQPLGLAGPTRDHHLDRREGEESKVGQGQLKVG